MEGMDNKNKQLTIAILDFDDIKNPLLGAGQARATYEVAKRLAAVGHKVEVYCSRYPGYQDRTEEGIVYKHIAVGTKHIRVNNLLYILLVPFYVRKIKADVIIESFVAPVSTLCSPLFTKIPVIGLPSMFNAKEFSKKYGGLPFHMIEQWGSRFYKYFLPYSDIDSQKMKALNPSIKYRIVPQGVDESFFTIPHKRPKHILFLSRLDISQKGVDLLIEAYAKIAEKIGYPLVIAGHGPDEGKIKKLINKHRLENKIKMVGSAYGKMKEDLIAEALYVVFPSRHDELSLWALEALASGMPLVAFDLPECRWAITDVCLKASPFDTDQYAELMVKAADPDLNQKMRKNARLFAKEFTWEKVATMFDEFINEVLTHERKN